MINDQIVIVGAGPAGLTAALELQRSGCKNVTIIESSNQVGGISKTISYKNNRIDIGGHRFFSKSDWVMKWWAEILPIEHTKNSAPLNLRYRGSSRQTLLGFDSNTNACENRDDVMLVRNRLSRIYYNKKFFSYPLRLDAETFIKLGFAKIIMFGTSYLISKLRPTHTEQSLEDFLINRFGKKLYMQFFKEYTEKVWGAPCAEISAEWGAQRIKSLSVTKAIVQAVKTAFGINSALSKQTSLIEHFIYPKYGPGQMWERVSEIFIANGGTILTNSNVCEVEISGNRVKSCSYTDLEQKIHRVSCDQLISTMAIKNLVEASRRYWDGDIYQIAQNLIYRDFITIGLLYSRENFPKPLEDNWIYIQEPGVQVGRVQIFNNWSPSMVADPNSLWLGLEYFCQEDDLLWSMPDKQLIDLAQNEMVKIGLATGRAEDGVVIRVPKAYPGYFGKSYQKFNELRNKLDSIENLFLIGRNGMHRYNNQDHSMLTAKEAAHQIVTGKLDKNKIWSINIDDEYHEESS